MGEVSFWQSAPFGVILAAVVTAVSTWLLWAMTRRRDDLLESRRSRLSAGVDAIRVAYRLRDSCNELLVSHSVIQEGGMPPEALAERDRLYDAWQAASHDMGEQLYLAQALAGVDVWVALKILTSAERESMLSLLEQDSIDRAKAAEFQRTMDWLLGQLADAVRADSRTDLGAKPNSRRQRRLAERVSLTPVVSPAQASASSDGDSAPPTAR